MAKPLAELLKKVSPKVKAEASAQAAEMVAKLRQRQGTTQAVHFPDSASTNIHTE